MEISESILGRKVVALDDRKTIGDLAGIAVDCRAYRIVYFVVDDAAGASQLAVPFAKVISVGDAFMTVQTADGVTPWDAGQQAEDEELLDPLGLNVYSRAGNALGVVVCYEVNATSGDIAKIVLENGMEFAHPQFVSLAQDYLFVNDGTLTDADKRAGWAQGAAFTAPAASAVQPVAEAVAPADEPVEEPADEPVAADDAPDEDPDTVLKAFLLGKTITERVEAADGTFVLEEGAEITEEVLDAAQAADALLQLTMAASE